MLTVSGRKAPVGEGDARQLLYSGIATRAFERRFQLADFVRVREADLADGLLTIDLVREVTEVMNPPKIAIAGAHQVLEAKKEEYRAEHSALVLRVPEDFPAPVF